MTSIVSPAFSVSPTQLENSPPPMRLTVTIQSRRRGGAERIVAADFLAVDVRAQRQMLAGAEGEALAQLGRNFEPDRIGFAGFGNDLRDAERVEMLGHPTTSRRDRCAAGTASRRADGRDARCGGRAGRRVSDAGRRAIPAALRQAPLRSRNDIPPQTRAGRARCPLRSRPAVVVDLEQFGDETPIPVESFRHPPALSSVPSPRRIVHSEASSR